MVEMKYCSAALKYTWRGLQLIHANSTQSTRGLKKKNQLKKSMSHNRKCRVVSVEIARREKKCPVGATCIQFVHHERTCGRAARAFNLKAMKPNPCVMTSFAFAARAMEEERGGGGNRSASVESLATAGRRSTKRQLWIPRLFHWHMTGSTWPGVSPRHLALTGRVLNWSRVGLHFLLINFSEAEK